MLKLIAWNIAHRAQAWRVLCASDADVALLQEANKPPIDITARIGLDSLPWSTGTSRKWRTAVVKLSDRVTVEWLSTKPLGEAGAEEIGVSRLGTLAAAIVTPGKGEPIIAISIYGSWEVPHSLARSDDIYADASVHRLISDLSVFAKRNGFAHDILIAGDFNILNGYGEGGDAYWAARYQTVFSRMSTLGLNFVGPQSPAGRTAYPWPAELPPTSKNIPTYYPPRQTPESATRQLDFVFASDRLAESTTVRALNSPEEWGPSDHCRLEICIDR